MKEITRFGEYTVEIWRRPRQRHMHLTVRPDGRLRVTCNKRIGKRDIFTFISDSSGFIAKRVLELEALKRRYPPKEFLTGETVLLFGERVPVQLVWTWTEKIKVQQSARELEILAPVNSTREARAQAVHTHYRRHSRALLPERLRLFSERMQLFPSEISIRGQTTRWGSCSARGQISLNWKLLAAPRDVIDYVIVHELAHIRHMDHSPRFWALVEQHFPGWRRARQWLKEHEPEIAIQFQLHR